MRKRIIFVLATVVFLLVSCEKGYEAENESGVESEESSIKVSFNIVGVSQSDVSETDTDTEATGLAQYCTRINLAAFNEAGIKTSLNQTSADSDFGTLSLTLSEGNYDVVIIAHSGTGNATISSVDEIKFPNNKMTDTFYYYGQITVSGNSSYDITLERAVAMFRFIITDTTPTNVTQMQFYYTGGSSTFDASTGFGCVQSRQTEVRDVPAEAYEGQSQYEVYTLPHATDDTLKVVVTALDTEGVTILERTFTSVPVTVNKVTQYTGEFFGSTTEQGSFGITLSIDTEWGLQEYSY